MTEEHASEIERALLLLHSTGEVSEIRALGRETLVGYFNDASIAAKQAQELDARCAADGIYVTLNPLKPAVLSRCVNRLAKGKAGGATGDGDVLTRSWLLVDLDPVRPSGISSSASEHDAALDRASMIALALSERGWPMPVLADSGNGAHLLYRIDLPNDIDSKQTVQKALAAIDLEFSDHTVTIDTTVHNAARIVRLYGTMARKGEATEARPHRRSALVDIPAEVRIVAPEYLEALARSLPAVNVVNDPRGSFDLDGFIERHRIAVRFVGGWNGGRKFVLERCVFDPAHVGTSAAILQLPNGAVVFRCLHNGCSEKSWRDVRTLYEPVGGSQPIQQQANPTFVRASALLDEPGEDIQYVIAGVLPLGGTAILAGRPKGGKSTTALNLALQVARGEPFLGRMTRKGPVLYVALEGAKGGWKSLIRKLGVSEADDLFLCIDRAPRDAIAWLREAIVHHQPVLVIIDTMQRLLRVKDGNDYASASNVTDAAIELARTANAALLFVHHSGKTRREDIVDEVMGSTGWAAAVDTVIVMRHTERCHTIASEQRFGEQIRETVLQMEAETHRVMSAGTKADADAASMVTVIVEFVREHADESVAEREIIDGVTGRKDRVQAALRRAVADGTLTRNGTGHKGSPFRYADSASLPPKAIGEVGSGNTQERDGTHGADRLAHGVAGEGAALRCRDDHAVEHDNGDLFAYAAERARPAEDAVP